MLREICCEQFCQKQIIFNPSLSVILGTNTGDNSIGKSTFLLIVDYVFGGSTYAKAMDIINNVGSHDIYFSFVFEGTTYRVILFSDAMIPTRSLKSDRSHVVL